MLRVQRFAIVMLCLFVLISSSFSKDCKTEKGNIRKVEANETACIPTPTTGMSKKESVETKISQKEHIERLEIASLKKETGECRAAITNYYFSVSSNSCEKFKYGGCGGNKNRFADKFSCDKFAEKVQSSAAWHIATSKLEKKIGDCRALIRSYYFDITVGQCKKFGYGGCDGNANKFGKKTTCEHFAKNVVVSKKLIGKDRIIFPSE